MKYLRNQRRAWPLLAIVVAALIAAAMALSSGTGSAKQSEPKPATPEASTAKPTTPKTDVPKKDVPKTSLQTPTLPVSWSGVLLADALPRDEVPECADRPCDRFEFDISLPPGVRNSPERSVEFAIRWSDVFDNLGLHVYRGATPIASADAPFATAQSVLVAAASVEPGKYTVYVSYDPENSSNTQVSYDGLVEVESSPKARPTRLLLPDLMARPQRNVTFETPLGFFEAAPEPGESCFASEVEEEGAQLCLRFDQVLANVGEGPLEMRFALPKDPSSAERAITQRIHWSHDPDIYQDTPAGDWEFHPVHDHFHYTGFAFSRLWAADGAGERVGSEPVRVGRKVSFCIVDIEIDAWARKGNGPRTHSFPNCLVPAETDETNDYLVQGITPGWSDIYDWFLPDQYIDVSGLSDGSYILETIADPDDTIVEADESNNCDAVVIRLTDLASAEPTASIVGPGPSCSAG